MRPYHNNSGSLNDPDQPEIATKEQKEAADEAESRSIEVSIDESRGDS